jgi:hypothetical protein
MRIRTARCAPATDIPTMPVPRLSRTELSGGQGSFAARLAICNPLLIWENDTVRPKIARVYDYRAPAVETLTM